MGSCLGRITRSGRMEDARFMKIFVSLRLLALPQQQAQSGSAGWGHGQALGREFEDIHVAQPIGTPD